MLRQTGVVVTLDGEILQPGMPLLHADDLAAVRGDGVFETLLVRDGRACLVEAHLQRLTQSARLMDLPEPDLPRWRRAVEVATQRWVASTADEGALRLIYSRGREGGSAPTAYVMVSPVPARVIGARRDGVSAITLDRGLPADGGDAMPWLMASAKTLSYAVNMAVLRHAARQGAGDVIFVSTDGYVLEGPRSTVVIATDGDQGREPLLADAASVVSNPAGNHATSALRSGPRERLRLRLPCPTRRRSLRFPRYLVGIEHDSGRPRTHPGRAAITPHPDR